jgi:acyl-CoA thioesterase FadM
MSSGPLDASIGTCELAVSRHTCGPRDVVRAGELWRLVQEATVLDSAARGWPPARYRSEGRTFVVRSLFGRHHGELGWGTPVRADTWVAVSGRVVFTRRTELRSEGAALLSAEVGWAHVHAGRPARAPAELIAALGQGPAERLPASESTTLGEQLIEWTFTPSFADTDPLGHVNHCRFVDWADELLYRWLDGRGIDPHGVRPHVDQLRFHSGSPPGASLTAMLSRVAVQDFGARFSVRFVSAEGRVVVEGMIERSHVTDRRALIT